MLNKNDPLIGAVQQVMQQSNAEREATRLVNEAFGIEDRKALPHEEQGAWDAVYKTVLTEGVEALDEGDDPLQDKADYLNSPWGRDRKPGIKDKRRKKKDRETYGKTANIWWSVKKNKLNPKRLPEEALDEAKIDHPNKRKFDVAPPYGELTKKDFSTLRAMGEDLEAIQEEIAYNLAEQAEYVYENYGEEGLVEFFESLTEEQLDILSMMEENMAGTPIRTNIGNWLSKAKDYIMNPQGIKSLPSYQGSAGQKADKTSAAIQNMNATAGQQSGQGTSGPNRGLGTSPAAPGKSTVPVPKPKPQNTASAPAAKSTNTSTAPKVATAAPKKVKKVVPSDIGSGGKQERGSSLGVTTGTTTGTTATNRPSRPLSKAMRDNPVASFRKAPKATVGAALRKPGAARNALKDKGVTRAGVAKGINNARSGKGSFGGGNRAGRGGEGRGGRGSLKEQIQNIIAEKAAGGMVAQQQAKQGQVKAPGSPMPVSGVKNTSLFSRQSDMQRATQNAGTMASQRIAAQKDAAAKKTTGVNAAIGKLEPTDTQRRAGMSITNVRDAAYGKNPTAKKLGPASSTGGEGPSPVPTASQATPLSTGPSNKVAMTARKIEAPGRQVSAKEIMNSKQYKQGVKDVGGEAAARKIKPGTNVAGVGKIEKGQTIYGNVEKQLSRTAVRGFEARKGGGGR